jgi:hypothetical protein
MMRACLARHVELAASGRGTVRRPRSPVSRGPAAPARLAIRTAGRRREGSVGGPALPTRRLRLRSPVEFRRAKIRSDEDPACVHMESYGAATTTLPRVEFPPPTGGVRARFAAAGSHRDFWGGTRHADWGPRGRGGGRFGLLPRGYGPRVWRRCSRRVGPRSPRRCRASVRSVDSRPPR